MVYDEVESCFSLYACDAYSLWVERSLVQLVNLFIGSITLFGTKLVWGKKLFNMNIHREQMYAALAGKY